MDDSDTSESEAHIKATEQALVMWGNWCKRGNPINEIGYSSSTIEYRLMQQEQGRSKQASRHRDSDEIAELIEAEICQLAYADRAKIEIIYAWGFTLRKAASRMGVPMSRLNSEIKIIRAYLAGRVCELDRFKQHFLFY